MEYAPGADRVFVWDSSGVGARTDYNGVLLLHTALQRKLPSSQPDKIIRIELVLSEVSSFIYLMYLITNHCAIIGCAIVTNSSYYNDMQVRFLSIQ